MFCKAPDIFFLHFYLRGWIALFGRFFYKSQDHHSEQVARMAITFSLRSVRRCFWSHRECFLRLEYLVRTLNIQVLAFLGLTPQAFSFPHLIASAPGHCSTPWISLIVTQTFIDSDAKVLSEFYSQSNLSFAHSDFLLLQTPRQTLKTPRQTNVGVFPWCWTG